MFASGRAWDQVRNTICYNNFDVKIVATHAGITVGEDGASHQAIEDLALMRCIPNMKVVVPCDGPETREVIITAFNTPGPFYIRLGRSKFPTVTDRPPFKLGKASILTQGTEVTIIACGILVSEALKAYEDLKKQNISAQVINMHTLRPLDSQTIIQSARNTKGIVVCEEHAAVGGLACAVDEIVCENHPTKVYRVNIKDKFGQSGSAERLLEEYHLRSSDIVAAAKSIVGQ